jgi:hypothetical protein
MARHEKGSRLRRIQGITWAIPATGAQRRIRALIRLGWTSTDIAQAAGWSHRNAVLRILNGQHGRPCRWVERKTYYAISEVYERMSMELPPMNSYRARSRTIAASKGWPPPLAWDDIDDPNERPDLGGHDTAPDLIAVQRFVDGEEITLSRSERVEAVRLMAKRGIPDTEAGRRLGISDRTVMRIRVANGIASGWAA